MTTTKAAEPTGYSAGPHFQLPLPGNRLRCRCCGHAVSAYAFDVIEPGFIRTVCTNCAEDLITIDIR